MNLQKKVFVIGALLSSVSLTSAAHAVGSTGTSADFGVGVTENAYDRTVDVKSDTKTVNVANGETVRFDVGGKTFAWHFSTFNEQSFKLLAIAPKDVHVEGVRVFVSADPLLGGP